ncbi:(d)CMP kinase [Intestinimonas massiliensis (ex Afouda et al. 2020)]|uniref:(d)CMP kinase n=1 Tax=Intestinimonas massiliensis (ex Afouda et al. 2020) TaxID=1673721 RepID=UPI001031672E|nr:(d)CMP kinase [Intestinimonas massiliensis (ex Afouda et al. 2020)]
MKQHRSIAIDGPSGAGKSTLAKRLAEKLGYLYVDTGAIYRTVGLQAFRAGVDPADPAAVIPLLKEIRIHLAYGEDGLQHMYLNGEDVTGEIRRHEISAYASGVSAIPEVRAFLLAQQRNLAETHDVVMDGRDIGTVVLPDADVKIFLTAAPEARARRRWLELKERGQDTPFETVLHDVKERDDKDTHRAAAPLRQAEDAVLADTTHMDLEQSLALLIQIAKERLQA